MDMEQDAMEAMETTCTTTSAQAATASIASTAARPFLPSIGRSGTLKRVPRWSSTTRSGSDSAGTRRGRRRGSTEKAAASAMLTKNSSNPNLDYLLRLHIFSVCLLFNISIALLSHSLTMPSHSLLGTRCLSYPLETLCYAFKGMSLELEMMGV